MMKSLFITLTLLAGLAMAQPAPIDALGDSEAMIRRGRFVTVTLLPGNPMKIFVAGKERLRLDLSDLKLEVSGTQAGGKESLEINRDGNYFVVKNSEALPGMKVLEVKTTLKKKKSETFRFNLNKP